MAASVWGGGPAIARRPEGVLTVNGRVLDNLVQTLLDAQSGGYEWSPIFIG